MNVSKQLTQDLINQNTLTIITCALACEAKPLIDIFKLKKNTDIHAFSVYQSGSVILIVSGLGQNNMSAAVNWLCGYHHEVKHKFWVNIGVAGHQSAEVGNLFCAHKISTDKQSLYPTKWLKHKVALEQLITADHEETDYQHNALYDMEGFAFYQSATRFNSQECVQCLKVVSDNLQQTISRDIAFISKLIANQCDAIVSFIHLHASALDHQYHSKSLNNDVIQTLINSIHFSHSQQLQLSKLCQSANSHDLNLNDLNFNTESNAKKILLTIKQHIDANAVSL